MQTTSKPNIAFEQALKMSEMFKSYVGAVKYWTRFNIGPNYCRLAVGIIHSNGLREREQSTYHFNPDGTYMKEEHL